MSVIVDDGSLSIRHMNDTAYDYALMVRWQNAPHVREWWDYDEPPMTLEQAILDYRDLTRTGASTTACVIEYEGSPVGYVQFYPWCEDAASAVEMGFEPEPGWWGLDILIGELHLTGRGLGTRTVALVSKYLETTHNAAAIALTTAVENHRAIRAYEKAGFLRRMRALDTDTKCGERVASWLMVRRSEPQSD
jgi:aminoglycoside 6'-N-acetyltransferase